MKSVIPIDEWVNDFRPTQGSNKDEDQTILKGSRVILFMSLVHVIENTNQSIFN